MVSLFVVLVSSPRVSMVAVYSGECDGIRLDSAWQEIIMTLRLKEIELYPNKILSGR